MLSGEVSSVIKKNITFQLYFDKFYEIYEKIIVDIGNNCENVEEKFVKVIQDLQDINEYITTKFEDGFKKELLKSSYNDYFHNALQIQNYLFKEKVKLSEYADRDFHPYRLDTVDTSNSLNVVYNHSLWTNLKRFTFFIQTNKGLTLRNASNGQHYMICNHEKLNYKVVGNDGMVGQENYQYLYIASTWPDLSFCGHDYSRVLISDANYNLIDVNDSVLADIYKILTE